MDAGKSIVDFVIKLFITFQKTLKSLSRYTYWTKEWTTEESLVNPWKMQEIFSVGQNIQAGSVAYTAPHKTYSEL